MELPKNAAVSLKEPVDIALRLTAASGPWGGDGGTPPNNLIVIDKNDTIHSMCIMHELGHLMNMVPLKEGQSLKAYFAFDCMKEFFNKYGVRFEVPAEFLVTAIYKGITTGPFRIKTGK
ncbi:MAG: hypothetical protein GF401_09365 [Chitinivibrionales bacterium]|nr:hypothetical protein [Chitinivibrionales bacterium]